MSLTEKLRNIVLGGALLLSGFCGGAYAQDSFPGSIGEKNFKERAGTFEQRAAEWEKQKTETQKSKISTFAIIDSYKPDETSLRFQADDMRVASIFSCEFYEPADDSIVVTGNINLREGNYSKNLNFEKKDGSQINFENEQTEARLSIGLLGYCEKKRLEKKLEDGIYLGGHANCRYTEYHDHPSKKSSGSVLDELGFDFFANQSGFQIQLSPKIGADYLRYKGSDPAYFFKAGIDNKVYLPIILKDDKFMFFKLRASTDYAIASSSEGSYELTNDFYLKCGFAFNINKKASLAFGPEFDIWNYTFLIMQRDPSYNDAGLINNRRALYAGIFLWFFWDWFEASLNLDYKHESVDFVGGQKENTDGVYVNVSIGLR